MKRWVLSLGATAPVLFGDEGPNTHTFRKNCYLAPRIFGKDEKHPLFQCPNKDPVNLPSFLDQEVFDGCINVIQNVQFFCCLNCSL